MRMCAECGSDPGNISFDRSLCACGVMHYFCDDCGAQTDECEPSVRPGGALEAFDRHADLAVTYLIAYLLQEREPLIRLARKRFWAGFNLYPDGPLFHKSPPVLVEEASEELADAIVYVAEMLNR